MIVYFIRHGSTDSLEKRISQPNDEPLNEKGINQSRDLAKRLCGYDLDMIISSPHTRALQTANSINDKVMVSELFSEVRKPKEVIGKSKEEEEVKAILKKISEMYKIDPNWHFSDEENFEDLKKRGLEALEYIKGQNKENIAVVSHANFMALMAGLMLFGNDYPVDVSLKIKNFLRFSTCGMSMFTFENERWQLQYWNDTSHLQR